MAQKTKKLKFKMPKFLQNEDYDLNQAPFMRNLIGKHIFVKGREDRSSVLYTILGFYSWQNYYDEKQDLLQIDLELQAYPYKEEILSWHTEHPAVSTYLLIPGEKLAPFCHSEELFCKVIYEKIMASNKILNDSTQLEALFGRKTPKD